MPADPSLYGLRVRQLFDFGSEVYGSPEKLCAALPDETPEVAFMVGMKSYDHVTTMRSVVADHVKPKTAGTGLSLAVLLNQDNPLRAHHFVSHGEPLTRL